jgi:TolB protein
LIDPDKPNQPDPLSRNIQWKRLGTEGYQVTNPSQLLDVEPNWSPDSRKLVFSSARTGHPMIYTLDLATKVAQQLTFAGVYNASPAWSPRGDRIVFATQKLEDGNFELYLIDPDGNNLNRLTMGESIEPRYASARKQRRRANNENPTWAPTGRHLAFSSDESGVYAIYAVTADGAIKRRARMF